MIKNKLAVKKEIFTIVILMMTIISCAHAGTASEPPKNTYFVMFHFGGNRISSSQNLDVQLTDTIANRYSVTEKKNEQLFGGIGLGKHVSDWHNQTFDLSASGYYFDLGRNTGIVHPAYNVAPDFDTLNYTYKGSSYSLLAEINYYLTNYKYNPFLYFGIGISANQLKDYHELPPFNDFSAAPMLDPFHKDTKYNLALGIGAGIKKDLNHNFAVAIGYRLIYLGDSNLGRTPDQSTDNHLALNKLYTNAVHLTLYIA